MNFLKKVDRILTVIRVVALVLIMVSTIGMCTVNIVLRYIIKTESSFRPFPWVNELMQMGGIWIAFLAASMGVRSNSHISLTSLVDKHMSPKAGNILKKAAMVIVLATLAYLFYYGVKTTIFQKRSYLQNIHLSYAWFYASIPVGCFYMFYEYLLILIFGKNPFVKDSEGEEEVTSGSF